MFFHSLSVSTSDQQHQLVGSSTNQIPAMELSTKNKHKEKDGVTELEEVEEIMKGLPKAPLMGSKHQLVNFQGFYFSVAHFKDDVNVQRYFQAQDTDIIIASHPKTGTTWLKSLLFALVNRNNRQTSISRALMARNPHELVPPIAKLLESPMATSPSPTSPRLLATHLPYTCLPESITTCTCACRIVYICRNPLDTLVSQWHFYPNLVKKLVGDLGFEPPSIQDFMEDFYHGRVPYGPFFDHVLGFWNQSLERPDKVLFLKYEELKDDTSFHLKKLVEFVDFSFSPQEESEGVIKEIVDMCNINNLKELKVNKNGVIGKLFEKKDFFRKGQVGDWINYLTPPMDEKIIKLMEQKLEGTGLSFQLLPHQ